LSSVLDLLVADKGNPRSLAFQLNALTEHATNLPRYESASTATGEQRQLMELAAVLEKGDIAELSRRTRQRMSADLTMPFSPSGFPMALIVHHWLRRSSIRGWENFYFLIPRMN